MTMGLVSIIILVGFFISLFPAMAFAIERDLPQDGDRVYGSNMVALTSGLWVLGLGIAGLYYRKRSQVHKRLMFLATIVILWPAWGRWRHYFPDTIDDNWFMLYLPFSFIIWAWIWEKRVYGKIHPILLIIGILIIAEGFLSSLYIGSEYCTALIKKLYSLHI